MGTAPIGTSGFLTASQIRSIAQKNRILLYRDQTLIGDYGDNRVTAADFATGLNAAHAAALPGDTIISGPIRAAGQVVVSQDDIKWYSQDTKIIPASTNYSTLLQVTGNRVVIENVAVDGLGATNNGSGDGIGINGDHVSLRNCESSRIRGLLVTNGSGLLAVDCLGLNVDGFLSEDVQYAGIRSNDCEDAVYRNVRILNCQNRSFNQEGTLDIQTNTLENFDVICDQPGTNGGMNFNIDNGKTCNTLFMRGVRIFQGDLISSGVSWNSASGENLTKFQSINNLFMDGCNYHHGANTGTGFATSFRFEDPLVNGLINKRVFIKNSTFAAGFTFNNNKPEIMHLVDSSFGYRLCDTSALCFSMIADEFFAENCEFNMHAKTRVFTMHASIATTDRYRFRNCTFRANLVGNAYIVDSSIATLAGRLEFSNPKMINSAVGGTFTRSSSTNAELAELALTTDEQGTMLYDSTLVGTGAGKHPTPGASAPYFPTLAVPAEDGVRIRNVRWTSGVKEWHSNAGQWKQLN